nr:PREDICTED: DNA repair protein complementing XP-G cells [Lepisosteus oculatus]
MGVQGLWKLLECTGKPINPETLEGKILAVDISIWLNQAVKGLRDRDGNAVQNAHLLTLFNRLCKLLFFRIRPVFVFDGEAPQLKKQTLAIRRQRKEEVTKESKQTSEKLLRTFLKRQAIKAALGDRSKEPLPSISSVRREEVDDIYVLPALEEKEKNSSEEEAEKEWEETANNRRMFQEEIFENPNSMDIDSEEFALLPAEIKHEILKDMKESSKRRRTLFETPPEESTDFSKYQLAGLLKRNSLNHRIEKVEKELNHQSSGVISIESSAEAGGDRDVETRRLVSEDTSHYILIKGSKKREDVSEDKAAALPSAGTSKARGGGAEQVLWRPGSEENLEAEPHSALRHPPVPQAEAPAPPSPRTLQAIQAALLDSSSEDEVQATGSRAGQAVGSGAGGLSPRTMQAIQSALTEDKDKENRVSGPSGNSRQDVREVIDVSSSDEEMVEAIGERNKAFRSFLATQTTPATESVPFETGVAQETDGKGDTRADTLLDGEPPQTSSLDVREEPSGHESAVPGLSQKTDQTGWGELLKVAASPVISVPPLDDTLPGNPRGPGAGGLENEGPERTSEESDLEGSFIEVSEEEEEEESGSFLAGKADVEGASEGSVRVVEEPHDVPGDPSASKQDCADEIEMEVQHRAERRSDDEDGATVNEWEDISLEELEMLESSLSTQQSSLQAQKQQQERIAATVTGQMYLESQELLRLFGIPFIVAPMEAEAQCALLDLSDQTHGTITDDSDVWLFGARHVYKNFFSHNKYVEYYQYVDLQNQLVTTQRASQEWAMSQAWRSSMNSLDQGWSLSLICTNGGLKLRRIRS